MLTDAMIASSPSSTYQPTWFGLPTRAAERRVCPAQTFYSSSHGGQQNVLAVLPPFLSISHGWILPSPVPPLGGGKWVSYARASLVF